MLLSFKFKKWKKFDISINTLLDIFSDLPKLKCVQIALEGEPFANKQIFKILNYIIDKTKSLAISTNGLLLTQQIIRELKQYNFSIFSLSIEASDKYSYEQIRKGGQFNTFVKNAEEMVNYFSDKVVFNSVLFAQNIKSICGLPKLANEIGVRRIGIMRVRMHDYCNSNGISEPSNTDLYEFIDNILENADKYNIKLIFDRSFSYFNLKQHSYRKKNYSLINNNKKLCSLPWHYTSLLSNGSIFPCCGDFKPEILNSYSFDKIFNHEYLLRLRSYFISKNAPKACKTCYSI